MNKLYVVYTKNYPHRPYQSAGHVTLKLQNTDSIDRVVVYDLEEVPTREYTREEWLRRNTVQ